MIFYCVLSLWAVIGFVDGESSDLEYSLNIGYAIDVFANYGDLSQVTQVVSTDYEDGYDPDDETTPFSEKSIRIFENTSGHKLDSNHVGEDMTFQFCDTLDDLLDAYFKDFRIEGTDKAWKAFMGDWITDEVARALGIEYNYHGDNCCYILVKVAKAVKAVQMDNLKYGTPVKNYVTNALENLNVSNPQEIRQFMKSYGTHYINAYMTGDAVYQVFTYKKMAYKMLKQRMRRRNVAAPLSRDDLRFYFSSYFLKKVGNVMVASGNKTVEKWARRNLRDSQYLYSRPSVLKLYYNPILAYKLKNSLINSALLGIDLKVLTPIFTNSADANKYSEMVENDLKLWEINA